MDWQEEELMKRQKGIEAAAKREQDKLTTQEAMKRLWDKILDENNKIHPDLRAQIKIKSTEYGTEHYPALKGASCFALEYLSYANRLFTTVSRNDGYFDDIEIFFDTNKKQYVFQRYHEHSNIHGAITDKEIICHSRLDDKSIKQMLRNLCTGKNIDEGITKDTLNAADTNTSSKGFFAKLFKL